MNSVFLPILRHADTGVLPADTKNGVQKDFIAVLIIDIVVHHERQVIYMVLLFLPIAFFKRKTALVGLLSRLFDGRAIVMATLFQPCALLLGQISWQIQDTRQRHCLIAFLKGHSSAAFADVSRMAFA
jgi:hypothetical protein